MAEFNIDQLLAPVSDESPTGENLEYDPSYSELERAAAGKEERYSGGEVIPAEDPDWKEVHQLALDLFARTKDLRVAVQLARAEAALAGIEGLVNGVALIRGLLEQFWDGIHPKLEAEDDHDPVFRLNALAPLGAPAGLLGVVRNTYLVEARSVGRFTFRDLDIAEERASPVEGGTPPSLELMKAALREAGSDYAEARVAHLLRAREDLQAIAEVFRNQAQGGQTPDVEGLDQALAFAIPFLEAGIARPQDAEAEPGADADAGAGEGAAGGGTGGLRSREDVKRILEQVCDFLARTEPSNPAPLLIMRAHRLLDRSFIDIIQDLAPEAFSQIEKIAGTAAPAENPTSEASS